MTEFLTNADMLKQLKDDNFKLRSSNIAFKVKTSVVLHSSLKQVTAISSLLNLTNTIP